MLRQYLKFIGKNATSSILDKVKTCQIRSALTLVQHGHRASINMISLSVDGNISSGKSTLVSKLVELQQNSSLLLDELENGQAEVTKANMGVQVEVIPEPLEKWCNVDGHNLLELFYKDPRSHNFLFEHYVQLTRLMNIIPDVQRVNGVEEDSTVHLRIMERSLQNNRHCFMELAKKNGNLHPAEFSVLAEWYTWMQNHFNMKLDLIIYLQTDPKVAYKRMKRRARAAEELCSQEYLQDLHNSYEDWLVRDLSGTQGPHVITLNANKGQDEVADECYLKLSQYLRRLQLEHCGL